LKLFFHFSSLRAVCAVVLERAEHPLTTRMIPLARARRTLASCALVVFLLSVGAARSRAAERLQLDHDQTVFYVMCAINAAGYDDGIDLPDNNPLRKQVRDYLASRRIAVLPELKLFYRHHMRKSASQDLPQYISWALSVTEAPDFAWKGRDVDVAPDAMALDGFQSLMIDFYHQADLESLWKKVLPAYDREIARYHKPILDMTNTVESYLRVSANDYLERQFHCWVELLVAPEVISTFHYADDTYVVISPSEQPRMYDIRHAYLFYQIDPIMIRDRAALQSKRSLLDLMPLAPLPDDYKTNIDLLASQSLVKAVEARLDKDTAAVDRATHQGFILTPFFAEQLPTFEQQQQGMRFYAEEMINAIDLRAETARLSTVKFDAAPLQRQAKQVVIAGPELSAAGKTLEKAETLYSARSLEEAKSLFTKALEQKGEPAEHAQAWYGLARLSLLDNKGAVALQLFQKTLESSPDDFTRGWSDVYLARIARAQHDFDLASKYYRDALAVTGASDKAKQAASGELQQLSKNQENQTQ
jgi:tetratricopeptide (TPR) repeat protein